MGASAAGIPSAPDEPPPAGLRASDAERDEVAARLRDEFVAGRLSHDTFVHRMGAVLGARRQADLPPLVADLPAHRQPARPQPARPQAVVDWIRGAFSRMTGHASHPGHPGYVSQSGQAGLSGVFRGTAGMRAADDSPPPLALRFPRIPRGSGDSDGESGGEFSIGRDASCDLAIPDMTVSRRHATLERTPDGWLISDLESTNGTRVNGWRVRGKVTVRPGDLISFGNLAAVFAREDTGPQPMLPTAPPTAPPIVPPTTPPATPPIPPPADSPAPGVP